MADTFRHNRDAEGHCQLKEFAKDREDQLVGDINDWSWVMLAFKAQFLDGQNLSEKEAFTITTHFATHIKDIVERRVIARLEDWLSNELHMSRGYQALLRDELMRELAEDTLGQVFDSFMEQVFRAGPPPQARQDTDC